MAFEQLGRGFQITLCYALGDYVSRTVERLPRNLYQSLQINKSTIFYSAECRLVLNPGVS